MPLSTVRVTITFDYEHESLDWRDELTSDLDRLEHLIVGEVGGENIDVTVIGVARAAPVGDEL